MARRSRLDGILRRIESMGVSGTERHWALIPPRLARRVRPRVVRVGDGILTLMEKSDSLRMNRVTGIGHRGAAKEAMIDAIIDHYRAANLDRFCWLMSPGPQVEEIARWLLKRGFEPHAGGHMLLLRDCRTPAPRVRSTVRIARARPKDAGTIVRIYGESFRMPSSRKSWSMAAVSAAGYEHYLAMIAAAAAAVGALRTEDGLAWLGGGATRPRWRRRGAHASLIAARLRRAARLECSWAWAETSPPNPGRPQGSYRNLIRSGFEVACMKPAFVWKAR